MLDGLKLLLDDPDCNLGWRIASQFYLKKDNFESLIKNSNANEAQPIAKIIDGEVKKKILTAVRHLKAILKGKTVVDDDLDNLFAMLKIAPRQIAASNLRDEM